MDAQNKQIENFLEITKEIVQKTLELCQAQQVKTDQQRQIAEKN